MATYAVIYAYGVPESELATVRVEHRDYLAGLPELLVAGPWDAGRGALILVSAESTSQVEALVAADPFVREGFVAQHEVHEWTPVLGPRAEHLTA